jgi:hypothetical protein
LWTKYTAIFPWAFVVGVVVLNSREMRWDWRFWVGQLLGVAVFLPWVFWRLRVEGMVAIAFWQSEREEWRRAAALIRWAPVALAGFAAAVWLWRKMPAAGFLRRPSIGRGRLLAWGTLAFVVVTLLMSSTFDFTAVPWTGWQDNLFTFGPIHFYVTRQIVFEPLIWWAFPAVLLVNGQLGWGVVKSAWFGLIAFLTAWGVFESRYSLPLVPFEHVLAIALLVPAAGAQVAKSRAGRVTNLVVAAWFTFSIARSLFVIATIAINNQFFYF